jgi:hypothetical protein
MSGIDHSLIHEAQRLITGANAHSVRTWILCYQSLEENSPERQRYENLLRNFVTSNRLTEACALRIAIEDESTIPQTAPMRFSV